MVFNGVTTPAGLQLGSVGAQAPASGSNGIYGSQPNYGSAQGNAQNPTSQESNQATQGLAMVVAGVSQLLNYGPYRI